MGVGTALLPRLGVRQLMSVSFLGSAVGMLITSRLHVGSSYFGGILPGMVVIGLSFGVGFGPIMNAALHQVTGQDSSLASAVQGAMQQIGGALGLACLVTLALRHATGQVAHGTLPRVAAAHGYVLSFRIGAVLLAAGAVLVLVLLERVSAELRNPHAEAGLNPAAGAEPLPSPAGI